MRIPSRFGKIWGRLAGASRLTSLVVFLFVVAVAYRPASAQYRIFWGDVHGHTSHSDGKGSLDDYFAYARDVSNLDFVIVTDHDFGNGNPTRAWSSPVWVKKEEPRCSVLIDRIRVFCTFRSPPQSEHCVIEGRNATASGLPNRLDSATPLSNLAR